MDVRRVMGGLTFVTVGGILLANQLGYLPWTVWGSILSLWPVLVIAAGIDIIGASVRSPVLRVLSSLVLIGALLYGALAAPAGGSWMLPLGGGQPFSLTSPHVGSVLQGTASIAAGATELTVGGGGDLANASGRAPSGDQPTLDAHESGDSADVSIASAGDRDVVLGIRGAKMDVTLDRSVLWTSLKIDAGAARGRIDLTDLRAENVALHCGASDMTVRFGDTGPVVATIDGGVSNLVVELPAGVPAEVRLDGGLTTASTSGGVTQISRSIGGGLWRTQDKGSPVITVTVKAGLANLSIQRI
jgi:hypothetical protein